MELITLSYQLKKEKTGFSVKCLDWEPVFTEGKNIGECKKNAIVATEMFLEELIAKTLHKKQYPKIQKHRISPFIFILSFDMQTGKYVKHVNLNRIKQSTKFLT